MTRKDARKTIIKARVYRGLAIMFAIGGLIAFLRVYFTEVEGHLFDAVRDPWIVAILLLLFLPSVTLSWQARRLERRFFKIMEGLERAA